MEKRRSSDEERTDDAQEQDDDEEGSELKNFESAQSRPGCKKEG